MSNKFKSGDKVKFNEKYNGYFRDLIGKELTIDKYFKEPKHVDDCDGVTIKEITEIHLIRVDSLEVLK